MDNNEFDLDALLNCDEFSRRKSPEAIYAMDDFLKVVKENVGDENAAEKIKRESNNLMYHTFNDAFKQGFCFAVKSVKFLMKS